VRGWALRGIFLGSVLWFVLTRALLHLRLPPFFSFDTYKYLGGADTSWAGSPLPPVFESLPVTGGALHAVPGYSWYLESLWHLSGGVALRAPLVVHSIISLLAYLLVADLVRQWAGRGAALAVFCLLVASPSIASLDQTLMPDALAAPVLLIASWIAVRLGPGGGGSKSVAAGGVSAGVLMGCGVLLRTSSQAFVPIPAVLALLAKGSVPRKVAWIGLYGVAIAAPLLPRMQHNYEVHGSFRLASSTGRNAYFSALVSKTADRASVGRALGIPGPWYVNSSFEMSDRTFQELLVGRSIPEADAAMLGLTLRAWAQNDLVSLMRQRGGLLIGLFTSREGPGVTSLRGAGERLILKNTDLTVNAQRRAERRFEHTFSSEVESALALSRPLDPASALLFRLWCRALALDGLPLLYLFLASVPALLLLGPARWLAFWCFVAPVLGYLGVYLLVGAPLYRYQVGLHPFMLTTIGIAAVCAPRAALRRLRRGRTPAAQSIEQHEPR
jgi:hypothetical protein